MAICENMQTMRFQTKEKKAKLLREIAMEKFGHGKGSISKALNEAVDGWVDKYGAKSRLKASDLRGLFSGTADSSMAAQRKAVKWFSEAD